MLVQDRKARRTARLRVISAWVPPIGSVRRGFGRCWRCQRAQHDASCTATKKLCKRRTFYFIFVELIVMSNAIFPGPRSRDAPL